MGRPTLNDGGIEAYSKSRLPGDLAANASAAADGDNSTVWQPGFGSQYQEGDWLEYDLARPVTFGDLTLAIVADHRHSVPTSVTVSTENGSRAVELPHVADQGSAGSVVTVPLSFPALAGRDIRITVTGVRQESTTNFYAPTPVALPLGIAEVGIPGVTAAAVPPALPGSCQSNLITIDARPVSVRIAGPAATALDGGEVSLVPCGPDAAGITLGPGDHVVQTALGHSTATGWEIDDLTLDSAAGGAPEATAATAAVSSGPVALPATQPGPAPDVSVIAESDTRQNLSVSGARGPFELVLGESSNAGWTARASSGATGKSVDLGKPQLVDGFANGWQVTRADLRQLGVAQGATFDVSVDWTPQSWVWVALVISGAALFLCVLLAVVGKRQRMWLARRFGLFLEGVLGHVFKRPKHSAHRAAGGVIEGGSTEDGPEESEIISTDPIAPVLASPINDVGRRPRVWIVLIVSVLTGLVVGAVTTPAAGAVALGVAAAAIFFRRARGLATLAAVGFIVAAGANVVSGQVTHALPESSNWPAAFRTAGWLTWFAVVSLGVDAVVTSARRRRPKRAPERP